MGRVCAFISLETHYYSMSLYAGLALVIVYKSSNQRTRCQVEAYESVTDSEGYRFHPGSRQLNLSANGYSGYRIMLPRVSSPSRNLSMKTASDSNQQTTKTTGPTENENRKEENKGTHKVPNKGQRPEEGKSGSRVAADKCKGEMII